MTTRIIITVLTAGVVLAGCSDPKPKVPDAKPSASASPTVPTMPPEAQDNSEDGAIAFVKHYVRVFNYASRTGDVSELSKLSSPDCEGCQSYIKLYKKTYANGGYYKDSDWKLSDITAEKQSGELVVFGTMNAPAGSFKLKESSAKKMGQPKNADLAFVPFRKGQTWLIKSFELQR